MNETSKHPASREALVAVLERLVDASQDAERGYALAAADIADPAMKTLLTRRSHERADFAEELAAQIAGLGAALARRATRCTLRGWVEVRAALPSRSDRMILEECDRGETAARKTYEAAMRDVPLACMPAATRAIVQRQYGALLDAHAEVRAHMWAH